MIKKILHHPYRTVLIGLLIAAIFLRIDFTLLPSFKLDMNTWKAWTGKLVTTGPANFYSPGYFADYFPGYLYMLWFLGSSYNFLFPNSSIYSEDFEIYLKLFTNLFDFLTAFLIYKIIGRKNHELGILGSILYLINPALSFNSSVWGQTDGILAFFLVLTVYLVTETKKAFSWSAIAGTSLIVKPQGLPVLPVSVIYFVKNLKEKKNLLYILLIPLVPIILSLPFFLNDPILGLFHLFQRSANTYPYTSMFSYNLWSFAGYWVPDSTKLGPLPYQIWGYLLFISIYLAIILPLWRKKTISREAVYLSCALAVFAFFLFLTRIHQRYLFPFFPFFLIFAMLKSSLKYVLIYLLLSFIHLINLLYVYYYYNYVFENSAFASPPLYQFLSSNYNAFSFINILFFILLLLVYYRIIKHD